MNKWISVKKRRPKDGQIIWAHFGKDEWIRTELCMYTPNFIVSLCEEDEGQWKGMSSTDVENWTHWMDAKSSLPKPPT